MLVHSRQPASCGPINTPSALLADRRLLLSTIPVGQRSTHMDRATDPTPLPAALFELAKVLARQMAADEFSRRFGPG